MGISENILHDLHVCELAVCFVSRTCFPVVLPDRHLSKTSVSRYSLLLGKVKEEGKDEKKGERGGVGKGDFLSDIFINLTGFPYFHDVCHFPRESFTGTKSNVLMNIPF